MSRSLGIGEQTYYRWRKEYVGLRTNQAQRLKALEQENSRQKRLVADLSLDNAMLRETVSGNRCSPLCYSNLAPGASQTSPFEGCRNSARGAT